MFSAVSPSTTSSSEKKIDFLQKLQNNKIGNVHGETRSLPKWIILYRLVSSYQLNAQFLYSITIYMLHYNPQHVSSSTMLISVGQIVLLQPLVSSPSVNSRTVYRLRADCSPLSTRILYGCLQRVTIPEAVVIQFVLLRMSSVLLETCWGL